MFVKLVFMKLILSLLILSFSGNLFAQQAPPDLKSKNYYLKKSRNQKTAGYVLMGAGIGAAVIGVTTFAVGALTDLIPDRERHDARTGAIVALTGVAAIVGSTAVFASARKNKIKAADFYMERAPITGMGSPGLVFPAFRVTVEL